MSQLAKSTVRVAPEAAAVASTVARSAYVGGAKQTETKIELQFMLLSIVHLMVQSMVQSMLQLYDSMYLGDISYIKL